MSNVIQIRVNKNKLRQLLQKYCDGTLSEQERHHLMELFKRGEAKAEEYKNEEDLQDEYFKKRIFEGTKAKIRQAEARRYRKMWYSAAASILIILGVSLFSYIKNKPLRTLVAMRGETVSVVLSDGTTVVLNAESKLTYPENFGDDSTREVSLEGEAFFEVTRNPNKPFIIHSEGVSTRVLGTAFNIESYKESEEVVITVVTGKVLVTPDNDEVAQAKGIAVSPNEQALFRKHDKALTSRHVESFRFTSWQDGGMYFDNAPLQKVVQALQRKYNVDIVFENEGVGEQVLTGSYANETLSNVLENIMFVKKGLKYEYLSQNKIMIKGHCN